LFHFRPGPCSGIQPTISDRAAEDVGAAAIIDKQPIPSLLFGVVGDRVFTTVVRGVAGPAFHYFAIIERKMYIAAAAPRVHGPVAKPEIELMRDGVGRTRNRAFRGVSAQTGKSAPARKQESGSKSLRAH